MCQEDPEVPDPPRDDPELQPTEQPTVKSENRPDAGAARIGPYRLLEKIGEGGMGEVWLAEQERPVKRRVALKVIKHGMDTKQVVARFEAERQALAMMDHPAVAKIFDAGSTPRGRPYFAMEYVRGTPITEHCDRHKLTNRERLELFVQVCEGVQHAHHKAIIHRDLKPSNVLVTEQEGARLPKIIDFGVAKATAQKLTEKTMFTELGVLIGTPEYMSPEQADLTGENVDTRTDVYALGVILYELLVGALPFDSKELRSAGFDGIRKKIRDEEPPRPSTRLSTLGDASSESAERRRVDLSTLQRQLKGDLDWIAMKALEKDRARRYSSPSELAADVGRFLTDQPVTAGSPSASYRAGKFVRRHRTAVVAAGFVLLALIGGMSAALFGLVQARQSEEVAREEAAVAERVSDFMIEIFREPSPHRSRGESVTAMEILGRGAARIESELADQPRVKLRMTATMGLTYHGLGLYEEARELLETSLEGARGTYGDDHGWTADRKFWLGQVLHSSGDYRDSDRLMLEALATFRENYGEESNPAVDVMSALGWHYAERGRFAEADPYLTRALELRREVRGDEHGLTLLTEFQLGFLRFWQGRLAEAESLHSGSFEARRRLYGEDSPEALESMNALALVYGAQDRRDEAEALFLECLALKRRVFGNDHPGTAYTTTDLGNMYSSMGRYDEAERLLMESLEARKEAHGEGHWEIRESLRALGLLRSRQGRPDEAERYYREGLQNSLAIDGENGTGTLDLKLLLGFSLIEQGRIEEGNALYAEVVEARRSIDHVDRSIPNLDFNLACLAALSGRREEALEHLRRRISLAGAQAWMLDDADLESLHGDPEFEELFAEIRAARKE
jgi:non-specific serine/threonine protein kinase/serine/threonine-protein kinase